MSKYVQSVKMPPGAAMDWPLSLVRLGGSHPINMQIRSADWFGFLTHFHDDRTFACPGADVCLLHEAGHQARWCGTVICRVANARGDSLFPFTQAIVPTLRSALCEYGTLAGVVCTIRRRSGNVRSAMVCTVNHFRPGGFRTYTDEQVRHQTERIFGATPAAKIHKKRGACTQ